MGKKKAASTKPGVMIYFEILPQLEMLKPLQRLAVFDAMMAYGKDRTEPVLKREAELVWSFIRPILDRDDERYKRTVASRKKAGAIRGQQMRQEAEEKKRSASTGEHKTAYGEHMLNVVSTQSQSTISNLQSTTINPQSTVVNPQSPTLKERGISPEAGTGTEGSFRAPSLEEVKAFVQQEKLRFLPEDFLDYYTANGWVIGGTVMKDWKAVARRWNRREKDNGQTESLYFGNYG